MQGCIRFSNGTILWFNDDNLHEVVAHLNEKQRQQLIVILKARLGDAPDNEFGVDPDVHSAWHESVHRKDIIPGGGSKNGESNINKKGTKKPARKWADKGDSERNITLLMSMGFRRRWANEFGYVYKKRHHEIPNGWLSLTHESFIIRLKELLSNGQN